MNTQTITDDQGRRAMRKTVAFAIPITIQGVLSIFHFAQGYKVWSLPAGLAEFFVVATFVYSALMIVLAILSLFSMNLEHISAQVKRNEISDKEWVRTYFKAVRPYIPAYNGSFSRPSRFKAGIASTAVYLFALIVDKYFNNAVAILASVIGIWIGTRMVRTCLQLLKEEEIRQLERRAKKQRELDEMETDD